MIKGIDVTYILSNNFDELVKWYNEKLSLEFGYGDSHWQEFVLEQGSRFAIHKSNSNYNKPNNIIISFKVEDINQTISQLQEKGIEFNIEKSGISIRKNGQEVLTQKWIETWRDYVPLDSMPTDTTQDANLDEVKYCGFSKCPNRYAYITRPDAIQKVFAH